MKNIEGIFSKINSMIKLQEQKICEKQIAKIIQRLRMFVTKYEDDFNLHKANALFENGILKTNNKKILASLQYLIEQVRQFC